MSSSRLRTPMQRRFCCAVFAVAALVGVGIGALPAHAAAAPKQLTKQLLDGFKEVKSASDTKPLSAAAKQANQAVFVRLDQFFDYDILTSTPIATHKQGFSAEQEQRFKSQFRELIRLIAYPRSGSFLRSAKLVLGEEKIDGEVASVPLHAEVKSEDLKTDVLFHWKKSGDGWKIVDVSFDGASLMKDYSNQFGRIIQKDGVAGLLSKVEVRLKDEQKTGVAD